MLDDEAQFQARLMTAFIDEADGHLETLKTLAEALARAPTPAADTLTTMVRAAHSLRGAARAVALRPIEQIALGLETDLRALASGERAVVPAELARLRSQLERLAREQARLATAKDAHHG